MAISIEKTGAQVTLCKDEKSEKVEKMKADILSINLPNHILAKQ